MVVQRLRFDEDEALTFVAGLNAQAKGRMVGIFKPHEEKKETGEGVGVSGFGSTSFVGHLRRSGSQRRFQQIICHSGSPCQ